MMRSDLKMRV